VRERIAAGDSDEQIRAYFARRYGDFVLLRPPFKGETALLWAAPIVLLAAGGAVVLLSRRGQKPGPNEAEDVLDDEL
jgi:cytochrome c-type biogenesis protein CcmH